MKRYLTIISFSILLIVSGCCSYTVSTRGLKSNCKIINGFTIYKITTDSINEKGVPVNYSKDTTIICMTNRGYTTKEFNNKLTGEEIVLFHKCQHILDSISKSKNNYVIIGELADEDYALWRSASITQDSIMDLRFPFKAQKKIYFKKANKYYKWIQMPLSTNEVSYIFPLKFLKNNWYMISGLSGDGSGGADYDIFFYIDNKGKWNQFNDYHPGPF